jgi:hypothetical protein
VGRKFAYPPFHVENQKLASTALRLADLPLDGRNLLAQFAGNARAHVRILQMLLNAGSSSCSF